MLGHIRSGTLDKFKEAFDKALDQGEGFSKAAQGCSQAFMAVFDEKCAGINENTNSKVFQIDTKNSIYIFSRDVKSD